MKRVLLRGQSRTREPDVRLTLQDAHAAAAGGIGMIEKSYGKFIADDGAAPLIRSPAGAKMRTFRMPSAVSASNFAATKVVPGGIEPPFAT